MLQGYLILSFWLVQNLSEGFPTSGNDNKTNIGFFDALRSLPQGSSHAEDLAQIPFPVVSAATQRLIAAEIKRRREDARRLRAEAETEWSAAKERFEMELLR